MSLGIQTHKTRRRPANRQTLIDGMPVLPTLGDIWWVDGTNGAASNSGKSPDDAFALLATALSKVDQHDVIFVMAKEIAQSDTDPGSYTEGVTVTVPQVSIIGVGNRVQGGMPQFKVGAVTTAAVITVRAPGVYLANLGINGAGGTGGGVKFQVSAGSYDSFGAVIENCHFKNCVGTTATSAATGGAIQLSGAAWQMLFRNNRFYKNVGGIVLLDTSNDPPQDIAIVDNSFGDSAAAVDCDIYLAGGSGPGTGLLIRGNDFGTFPALPSGATLLWMDLTGADGGLVAGNYFANDKTFGAAGSGAKVPTTVFLSGNYDEGGLIARV